MTALLWPVVGHLVLVQVLFAMVSLRRHQAVRAGDAAVNDFAWGQEPERSRRWARNLDNQFQLPMLFHVLVALIFATGVGGLPEVVLAWAFLLGRLAHSWVQVSGDDVTLRGRVFAISYVGLSLMWLVWLARMAGAS